jgi:hypothetical protein
MTKWRHSLKVCVFLIFTFPLLIFCRLGANLRLTAFYPVQVRLAEETWVLCYGRGFMPLSGAHIKIGEFLSCCAIVTPYTGTLIQSGDMMTFARLMYAYGQSSLREFGLFAQHMFEHVKKTYLGM